MSAHNPVLYTARAVGVISLVLFASLAISVIQILGLFLLIVSRHSYRTLMRFSQRLFGSLVLMVTYIYAPLRIEITGCHQELKKSTFAPIMANHQIYTVLELILL